MHSVREYPTIGLVEKVSINGKNFRARIDTGARTSSIDKKVAKRLELGPVIRKAKIKSASGRSSRSVVKVLVKIKSRNIRASFNIANREEMQFSVLIGRNILKKGFLIDTRK